MHKIKIILQIIPLLLMLTFSIVAAAESPNKNPYEAVNLDEFLERRTDKEGKKVLTLGTPISFEATVKQLPQPREVSYVYKALELARFDPIPEVGYRMFLESNGGKIAPFYVEKTAAEHINKGLKEGDNARFVGNHLYNYSKGPAILVVDFKPIQK